MTSHFSMWDQLIVISYMAGSIVLGLRFSKKQKSVEDYFISDRSVQWWAVGISLIATNLSAVSYLGETSWLMQHDLQLDVYVLLVPLVLPLVARGFLPFLARLRVISIYEYLEHRFGLASRLMASSLFLLLRGGWLATAIYTQSLMIAQMLSMPLWMAVTLIGLATAIYTTFGGIEAVLWTDVMQFFVLVGGLLAMFGVSLWSFGGDVGQMWRIVSESGHTRMFNFAFSTKDINVWAVLISLVVINTISTYGSDQLIVQRLLTAGDERQIRRSLYFTGWLNVAIVVLLVISGLSLVAYYQAHPELRATLPSPDSAVPHFIEYVLPSGLSGLVLAGVLAATMSSLSAGFNSLGTATMIDFYRRLRGDGGDALPPREQRAQVSPEVAGPRPLDYSAPRVSRERADLRLARWITLVWAAGTTFGAMYVGQLGTIVQIVLKINGWFTGPILGMFVLGVLTRRANSFGVIAGSLIGAAATWWVSTTDVHWLWYSPVGSIVTVICGYVLSLFGAAPAEDVTRFTIWAAVHERGRRNPQPTAIDLQP